MGDLKLQVTFITDIKRGDFELWETYIRVFSEIKKKGDFDLQITDIVDPNKFVFELQVIDKIDYKKRNFELQAHYIIDP